MIAPEMLSVKKSLKEFTFSDKGGQKLCRKPRKWVPRHDDTSRRLSVKIGKKKLSKKRKSVKIGVQHEDFPGGHPS